MTVEYIQEDMELMFAEQMQKAYIPDSQIDKSYDYLTLFLTRSIPELDSKGNKNEYLIKIQNVLSDKGETWCFRKIESMANMALLSQKTTMQALCGTLFYQLEDTGLTPHSKGVVCSLFLEALEKSGLFFIKQEGNYIYFIPKILQKTDKNAGFVLPSLHPFTVHNNNSIGYGSFKEHIIAGHKLRQHDYDICLDHINRKNATGFMLDMRLFGIIEPEFNPEPKIKKDGMMETKEDVNERRKSFDQLVDELPDKLNAILEQGNEFYFAHKYDSRLRTYLKAFHFNYQQSKFLRGLVQLHKGCIVHKEFSEVDGEYSPYEWLLIDIASQAGLDKKDYDTRLAWTLELIPELEENMHKGMLHYLNYCKQLADFADIDERPLFCMGLIALYDIEHGQSVHYAIGHDAASSGPQLLSVMTRCVTGMRNTGVLGKKVPNLYQTIADNFKSKVTRNRVKKATVPFVYGSDSEPIKVFGADVSKFIAAYRATCEGAYWARNILINGWNPKANFHEYIAPDAGVIHVKVLRENKISIHFKKGNTFIYKEIGPIAKGSLGSKSLAANTTHGMDAYFLRELSRRCDYDGIAVRKAKEVIEAQLIDNNSLVITDDNASKLMELEALTDEYNMLSVRAIDYITSNSVCAVKPDYLERLLVHIEDMLTYRPFKLKDIHDDFGCLPIHVTDKKRVYNDLLAELYESTWLFDVIEQLTGQRYHKSHLPKFDPKIQEEIRKNLYSIN